MKRAYPALVFVVGVILAWEVAARAFSWPQYLIPAPSVIARRFLEIYPVVLAHTTVTALEAVLGFALGTTLGVLLSVAFVHSRYLELAVYPYAIALKTVPIVAIAPLLVVWAGNGLAPKVLIAAVISFFPVVVNTTKGLRSFDREASDLFSSMAATKAQFFFRLRVPSALPYLFAALRISSTLAVIGAIVGEFSGADRGLGFMIMVSSYRLETAEMFVAITASSVIGIVLFYGVSVVETLLVPWSRQSKGGEL